jgi:hypothetical protein
MLPLEQVLLQNRPQSLEQWQGKQEEEDFIAKLLREKQGLQAELQEVRREGCFNGCMLQWKL